MASKRKRGRSWYARVFWYENGRKKETQISLKTANEAVAMERLATVEQKEAYIKKGFEFTFEWMSDSSVVQLKRFELGDAINTWMKKRNKDGIRPNSIQMHQYSLRYLKQALGKTFPLASIQYQDIERYIGWLREKRGMNVNTINMHLSNVRTMLNYFYKIEKIKKLPMIQMLSVHKKEPIYITDEEFSQLQKLESLDGFYKRVFLLYRDTGMRLREPLIATLSGKWIDISADSKSHSKRSIPVKDYLIPIFRELKTWLESGYGSGLKDVGDHISKKFKWALNSVDVDKNKHFHSLRHTFAVRSLLSGKSIYDVKLLMGHAEVRTTEGYSNMNLKRVAQDFPSLKRKSVSDNSMVDNTLDDSVYLEQYVKILA